MDRRHFIGQISAGVVCTVAGSKRLTAALDTNRIIDTHTHFYDPTRKAGVPWPPSDSSLYRPVYPEDWLAVAKPHGIMQTVVVEASAWLEDNQWILDVAKENPSIVGFVGNLIPSEVNFGKHLKRFAANPIYRGIRISGQNPVSMDNDEFKRGIQTLADNNLELDVNGPPTKHETTAKLAKAFPSLRIVVDHVGISGDAKQLNQTWKQGMASLGELKNVYCKVSALTEQSEQSNKTFGSAPRDVKYYAPILDHCWNCFGEDRLIYGSNWPVCEKGGTYADQFNLVHEYFQAKGTIAYEKYFWKNAVAAYGLKNGK